MAVPIEIDGDAGKRAIIGLDAGDRAGKRSSNAQVLCPSLGQRDVGGFDDDPRLAAGGPRAAGQPDGSRRMRNLGKVVLSINRGKTGR